MNRINARSMKIQVLDQTTGEVLTITVKPNELARTIELFNTLNNDGKFVIDRIYAYGEIEETVVSRAPHVVWEKKHKEETV